MSRQGTRQRSVFQTTGTVKVAAIAVGRIVPLDVTLKKNPGILQRAFPAPWGRTYVSDKESNCRHRDSKSKMAEIGPYSPIPLLCLENGAFSPAGGYELVVGTPRVSRRTGG
jgi:hypothetical protein